MDNTSSMNDRIFTYGSVTLRNGSRDLRRKAGPSTTASSDSLKTDQTVQRERERESENPRWSQWVKTLHPSWPSGRAVANVHTVDGLSYKFCASALYNNRPSNVSVQWNGTVQSVAPPFVAVAPNESGWRISTGDPHTADDKGVSSISEPRCHRVLAILIVSHYSFCRECVTKCQDNDRGGATTLSSSVCVTPCIFRIFSKHRQLPL
jgi:hypothetical protein